MAREPFVPPLRHERRDGESVDDFKDRIARERREAFREWQSHGPTAAAARPDGSPLYRVRHDGTLARTAPLSASRKRRVRERDGNRCVFCGADDNLEIDHIVRYRDGGSNELDNLRTLCRPCHGKRGRGR